MRLFDNPYNLNIVDLRIDYKQGICPVCQGTGAYTRTEGNND